MTSDELARKTLELLKQHAMKPMTREHKLRVIVNRMIELDLKLVCPLCRRTLLRQSTNLHELIPRSMLNSKELLAWLPVELHMVICGQCNFHGANINNRVVHPDSYDGRRILFNFAVQLWGIEAIEKAIVFVRETSSHTIRIPEWEAIKNEQK